MIFFTNFEPNFLYAGIFLALSFKISSKNVKKPPAIFLLFSAHIYNMEGKSFTQRRAFFKMFPCQLSRQNVRTILNLEFFNHQTSEFAVGFD